MESKGSTQSRQSAFSSAHKPTILRPTPPNSSSSTAGKRKSSRIGSGSLAHDISERKKKLNDSTEMTSPVNSHPLLQLADVCEDRYLI